jgi:hypothetical protein
VPNGTQLVGTGGQVTGIEGPQNITVDITANTITFASTALASGFSYTCSDSCSAGGYIPADFEVRRNFMLKPPTWNPLDPAWNGGGPLPTAGQPFTVKNGFEFKNGTNILFEGNVITGVWNTVDENGSIILITAKASGNCGQCRVINVVARYNRGNHTNVAFSIANADTCCTAGIPGGAAYAGHHYSVHDWLISDVGGSALTCSWAYTVGATACNATDPVATSPLRSGGPNLPVSFILHDSRIDHITYVSQNSNNILVTGGGDTQPGASYNMEVTNSIMENGPSNVANAGGGATSCAGQTGSTPASRLNDCWNPDGSLLWDYNALYDNLTSGGGECNALDAGNWPGTHNQFFDSATSSSTCSNNPGGIGFLNWNGGMPLGNGSNFAVQAGSPLHQAGSDGNDTGANVGAVEGYTFGVDVLP